MYRFPNKENDIILLRQAIHGDSTARYLHRCHIVLFVIQFQNVAKASLFFNKPRRTIQTWISDYLKEGLNGLKDKKRSARSSVLTDIQLVKIKEDLQKNPMNYKQACWDGKLLSYHLLKHYKVKLGVRQYQRLFHKLGFSLQRPRTVSTGDKEEQDKFKKNKKVNCSN